MTQRGERARAALAVLRPSGAPGRPAGPPWVLAALAFFLGTSASFAAADWRDDTSGAVRAKPVEAARHPERRRKEPLECQASIGSTDYGHVQTLCGCAILCERGLTGRPSSQICREATQRISSRLPHGMVAAGSTSGGVCTIEIPLDALVVNRSGTEPLSIFCQRRPENASVVVQLQEIRQPDAECTCPGLAASPIVGYVAVMSFRGRHRCRDGHVHTISDALSELHAEDSAALVRHVWRSIDAALRQEAIQPYRLTSCIDKHPDN